MQTILAKLQTNFPELRFKAGTQFCWSPETGDIFYNKKAEGAEAIWALLHEAGHALLGHQTYKADFELLRMEIEAWERARSLAEDLNIQIDNNHIEDCLDTYRDWLYKRSVCPTCSTTCLQQDDYTHYRCFNCHTKWRVSTNRFSRPYRATKHVTQTATIFHQNQ